MQFSLKKPLVHRFCSLNCLIQQIEANLRLAEARISRGRMAQVQRSTAPVSAALGCCNSVLHELDPELGIAALGQQGALNETCSLLIVCEAMLDAVSQSFIGVSCGPF